MLKELDNKIVSVLTEEPQTIKEIMEKLEIEDAYFNRVVNRLTILVKEKKVFKFTRYPYNKEKKHT